MPVGAGGKRNILALNCGSSSLKFGLYSADAESAESLLDGEAEEIGGKHSTFWFQTPGKPKIDEKNAGSLRDHAAALAHCLDVLTRSGTPKPEAVGHRFVHGGPHLTEHTLLNDAVQKQLNDAVEYAPLHLPASLAVLEAAKKALPGLPQVICFDTAFHRTMPEVSRTYALPEKIRAMGVQRYGFHGLSLESIVAQMPTVPKRMVIAHLGNGSSITALRNGASIDTSMGMTPTGGVMMGTRTGDLDPGVVIYMLRHGYATPEQVETLVNHQAGLLAVSGVTSDVRDLLAQRQTNHAADLALTMFCYQVKKTIAGMAAALGGLDTLVFTGGIGEHAAPVREEVCRDLAFLGIDGNGLVEVKVLPAEEDKQIAKNAVKLLD